MLFNIIIGVIMAVAFIGMIVCSKKQADIPIAKPMAIVLVLVVLACAVTILVKNMGSGDTKKLIENEMEYARVSTLILGQHLAQVSPGSKAVIVVDRQERINPRQQTMIDALKNGLGNGVSVLGVETPQIEMPEMPAMVGPDGQPDPQMAMEMMPPIQELMQAKHFDEIFDKYPSCNLMISLIGLPRDIGAMKIWKIEDPTQRPKIALAHGEIYELKNAIIGGAIIAAVAYSPDAEFDEKAPPKEAKAAFDKRYLLITPENVAQIAAKYKIFKAE